MPLSEDLAGLGLPIFHAESGGNDSTGPPVGAALGAPESGGSTDPPAKSDVSSFSLGEGLPPVPAKLVAKILKGDYIDMAELLRDNMEAERRRPRAQHAESAGPSGGGNRREVPDLFSWIQCFGMYAAVVTSRHPEKTQQLFAYQTMIVREARRCGGKGWLAYDSMFRQQASLAPACDWSKLNNSLYSVTFMAQQNGRGRTCTLCLETDHAAVDCALAPAYRPNRQGGREFDRNYRGHGDYRGHNERSERICYSWNDSRCSMPYCRYRHVCAKCHSSDHKAIHCSAYPAQKSGPNNAGRPAGPRDEAK